MFKRLAVLSSIVILLSSSLIGCSSSGTSGTSSASKTDVGGNSDQKSSKEKVKLRIAWWGGQLRHDLTTKVIEMYKAENPNVEIETEFLSFADYLKKMSTEAAGGQLPDVLQMSDSDMPEYVKKNLLIDLDSYVKSGVLNLKDVDESYISGGKINNKLYGINLGSNGYSFAYDPEMFKQAGVEEPKPGYTWDDFAKTAGQLKDKLGSGIYGTPLFDQVATFKMYLFERGKKLYAPDGSGLGYEDDQLMVDWFEYWNKLRKAGIAPSPANVKDQSVMQDSLLVQKKAPLYNTFSNQIGEVSKLANRPIKLMVLPEYPGGEKAKYLRASMFFTVAKQSKYPEEAVKFINYFTNNIKANEILAAERGVPISSKVREHLLPMVDASTQESFKYVELIAKQYPPRINDEPPGAGQIDTGLYARITEQVDYDKLTPKEAAKQFREQATKMLKDLNKK